MPLIQNTKQNAPDCAFWQVACEVLQRKHPLMSEQLAPFVHGRATPLLKAGFVTNTQVYTSHSLGPDVAPLKLLTNPSQLSFERKRERESRRDLSERKDSKRCQDLLLPPNSQVISRTFVFLGSESSNFNGFYRSRHGWISDCVVRP